MKRRFSLAVALSALVAVVASTSRPVVYADPPKLGVSLTTSAAAAGDRFHLLVTVWVYTDEPTLVDVVVDAEPGARLVGFSPLGTEYCFGFMGETSAIRCWSHRTSAEPMFMSIEYESHPYERSHTLPLEYRFHVNLNGSIQASTESNGVAILDPRHDHWFPLVVR